MKPMSTLEANVFCETIIALIVSGQLLVSGQLFVYFSMVYEPILCRHHIMKLHYRPVILAFEKSM